MRKFELGLSIGALATTAGILLGCESTQHAVIPNCTGSNKDPYIQDYYLRSLRSGTNKVLEIGEVKYKRNENTGDLMKLEEGHETSIFPNLLEEFDEEINGRDVVIQFTHHPKYIEANVIATCD